MFFKTIVVLALATFATAQYNKPSKKGGLSNNKEYKMKFLILFACALAYASAGYIAAPLAYHVAPQHLPVIDANGVPVEPLANQVAKAEHLAHKAYAHARNGDVAVVAAAAPVVSAYSAAYPWINHAAAAYAAPLVHYRKRRGIIAPLAYHVAPQHLPVIDANGVPVEPLANQVAKAEHLVHKANAHARNGDVAVVAAAAPVVSAYSAAYPWAHPVAAAYSAPLVHYRKRRGTVAPLAAVTPVAYSSAYSHPLAYSSLALPYATSTFHGTYSALPYAHVY